MAALPTCVKGEGFDKLELDGENVARTREINLFDRNGYIEGDVPKDGMVVAGHGSVYISGTVGDDCRLSGRKAMFSARTVSSTTKAGGRLLVVGDETNKDAVRTVSAGQSDSPIVLMVPESQRAEVFDYFVNQRLREANTNEHGVPVQSLVQLARRFPRMTISCFWQGDEIDFREYVKAHANQRGRG